MPLPSPPLRVPWSEMASVAAGLVAFSAWRAAGREVTAEHAAVALLAVTVALVPRRALASREPAAAEAAAVAGALAALSIAALAAGPVPPGTVFRVLHGVAAGEVLGLAALVSLATPLRTDTLRRALAPAALVGTVAAYALWSRLGHVAGLPDLHALAPAAGLVVVVLYAHAIHRPHAPVDRARLVAPGLGAAALTASILVTFALDRRASPLVMAAGLAAQVTGLTLGTGAIGLDQAARLARRCAAGAVGVAVGTVVALGLPDIAAAGAPVGTLVMLALWPVAERRLRPDEGRLLDACDEIERELRAVSSLTDLATAVLDPLRVASRNLRAPAALWLLDRRESLRIDVTGAAAASPLSLEAERALLSWLRARPVPVFTDCLRPHVVRRAELRPVLAALESHAALGAVPLLDDGELAGVILLPRGARTEVPTWEEESRLVTTARAVTGAVSLLAALERSREREAAALRRATEAEATRDAVEREHRHVLERASGTRALRSLAAVESTWVAYSAPMRALCDRLESLDGAAPVLLVAEAGAGAAAVARRIHAQSAAAEGPFVVLEASALHARDALAALVGDARSARPAPGWLEHAAGGTLVVEDVAALGHDALVALWECLRDGRARRLGAVDGYACRVRLVMVSRRPLVDLDLPGDLAAAVCASIQVPPLRARGDDLESLALAGIDRATRALARAPVGIAPEAMAALRAHPWPGNVHELFEALESAVARTRGTRVTLDALPAQVRASFGYAARARHTDADDEGDDEGLRDDA